MIAIAAIIRTGGKARTLKRRVPPEGGTFRGWDTDDQPYIKGKNFDSVDEMRAKLDRAGCAREEASTSMSRANVLPNLQNGNE